VADLELVSLVAKGLLPLPNLSKSAFYQLRLRTYFESLSALMIVIFQSLVHLWPSFIPLPASADNFLPFMLQHNQISEPVDSHEIPHAAEPRHPAFLDALRPFKALEQARQSQAIPKHTKEFPTPSRPATLQYIFRTGARKKQFLAAFCPGSSLSEYEIEPQRFRGNLLRTIETH
jgi:hypothetical protein